MISNLNDVHAEDVEVILFNENTENTPTRDGATNSTRGVVLSHATGGGDYYGQLAVVSGDIHMYTRRRNLSGITKWGAIALMSDLNNCLIYKGVFSGDFNNVNIAPGIYRINTSDTYSNGPKREPQYGTFIQFFNFNIQVIIDCRSICMRRYVGSPAVWESWYSISAVED